jgi:aspartate aminotransferase
MQFAKRMERLGTENAFTVLAQVTKLREEGKDIINFGVGEPDYDTPSNIKKAGIAALENNKTHYSPPAGIPDLRREVAKYVSKTRGIEVCPDEVLITSGVKPMIFYAIYALIEKDDEVVYPNPGYPGYESIINFAGGKPVPLPLIEEKKFSFDINDLKKAVTEKTKMIVINSPANPTGGILSHKDLEGIAEIAIKNNIWVLSDEIYSRIIYNGQFKSIASIPGMKERTIILEGFSKIYAMTGWRLGYGVMTKELTDQAIRLQINIDTCSATFTQYAGIEAYRGPQEASCEMVSDYKERRDMIVKGLNDIKGIHCLVPDGAFYVFPNVTQACKNLGLKNSAELHKLMLQKADVAVLPRTSFGVKNAGEKEEYVRMCYAVSRENIIEGLRRIKNLVENNI